MNASTPPPIATHATETIGAITGAVDPIRPDRGAESNARRLRDPGAVTDQ